jgi:hypothetical protein
MKIRLLTLLPLLILFLPGCSPVAPDDSNITPYDSSGVMMPLAAGNMWMGKKTTYDSGGNVVAITFDTLEIVGQTTDAGETRFRTSGDDLYVNRADGLWGGIGNRLAMVAKYPAKKGDHFNEMSVMVLLPDEPGPVEQKTAIQVMNTDTTITVPAGTFRCHHYRPVLLAPASVAFVSRQDYFYARNVGAVLIVNSGSAGSRWELVRAELK